MTSRRKLSVLSTLVVGVLSLLLIALPGTAAARHHHKGHSQHKRHHKHHKRHHQRSNHRTGSGSGSTTSDEENLGSIATFDGTTLTIDLTGGGQMTGTVNDSTEIQCEANDDNGDNGDDNGDDDGNNGDDNSGNDDSSGSGGGGDDVRTAAANSTSDDGDTNDDDGDNGDDDGNNGDDDGNNDNGGECTTADLTPGTVIEDAELDSTGTFTEIDLVK